jgi:hypothetical protein
LLSSLPPVTEEWSEAEELAEAERREREIETDQAQALHDGEFWQRVEARLSKCWRRAFAVQELKA